jgi:hypothetical protein
MARSKQRRQLKTLKHPLKCRCGTLAGFVDRPERANRVICYCRDCQSFAHFLGRTEEILDVHGGTDVLQVIPANVQLTKGHEALACVRLSERGLIRWYARCCNTPIGNTLANPQISFIGLVHSCLDAAGESLDASFGPVRMRAFTRSAKGAVASSRLGLVRGALRFLFMLIRARLDGSYRRNPFFVPQTNAPIVMPRILAAGERDSLRRAL